MMGSTAEEFQSFLEPVLDLTAPSGMGRADRGKWVKAAILMLAQIPRDLLAAGCRHAMTSCDHPSKIVPEILKSVRPQWDARKARVREIEAIAHAAEHGLSTEIADGFDYTTVCSPERAREIRKEFGIYDKNDDDPKPRKHKGRAKLPSRADYIDLGMTPEQCDAAGIA